MASLIPPAESDTLASIETAGAEFVSQLDTTQALQPAGRRRRSHRSPALGVGRAFRWTVFAVVTFYFLVPILASLRFTLQKNYAGGWSLQAYKAAFSDPGFLPALTLSAEVAAGAAAITLVLLVPTVIWVHLRLPKMAPLMDSISILALAVPPVVLAYGMFNAFKGFTAFFQSPVILALVYVVLALPFTYRALSAGARAIDLHTLVDAGRSLGSSWGRLLFGVLLPNMKVAVLNATFLVIALAFGEFAIASLLNFTTFPQFITLVSQMAGQESVALSMFALFAVWALLLLLTIFTRNRKTRSA
jgi:putative spermidine/putrescine transport system permease protein